LIRRLAGLAVVLGLTMLVRHAAGGDAAGGSAALGVGFALIAAVLVGELADRLGLPRLTGYLALGLFGGPFFLNLITHSMARELRLLNGLAVTLIAFVAGLELNIGHLRPRIRAISLAGGVTIAVTWMVLFAGIWVAWPYFGIDDAGSRWFRAAVVAVMATLAASFSPTVTIAVLAEARARGPLTELTIALVIIGDLIVILLFSLFMQMARWTTGTAGAETVGPFVVLMWEIFGSLAFGAALGAIFAAYLAHVGREVTLVLLGLCAVLSETSGPLHLDAVLAALAAGIVVENIAPPRGDALKQAVERGSLPVLIVFFAAAGASLDVEALAATGLVAVTLALLRAGAIWAGARLGTRAAGIPRPMDGLLWCGLISQAGVTLGLATIVAREFPAWGGAVQTFVLALTALHVLAGPVLFRAALGRAGEIGRMDAQEVEEPAVPAPVLQASR
jgi:Kef-type K+ transport system membrane component KefB